MGAVAVVPFPQRRRLALPDLARLAPSGRSLLAGFAFVGLAALTYLGARETSVFAIRAVDVRGAPPATAAEVPRTFPRELRAWTSK